MKTKIFHILSALVAIYANCARGESVVFFMPESFSALQRFCNSEGMSFEAKIYRSGKLLRIEPLLKEAQGGFTLLDLERMQSHLIIPATKKVMTYPYTGVSANPKVIDDSFLYLFSPIELEKLILPNSSEADFSIKKVDGNYVLTLDNKLEQPVQLLRSEGPFWTAIQWENISIGKVDPALFSIPKDYTPLVP